MRHVFSLFLVSLAVTTGTVGADGPTVAPPVPGYPIGWCTRVQAAALDDAQTSQFEYIELALQDVLRLKDDEFASIAQRLQALRIPALTGYNSVPGDLALVGPAVDRAKQDQHLAFLLSRASALKLRYLILNSGKSWRVPEGFARDRALSQLAEFSTRFATQANEHGITVLIEPLRSQDSNMIITIAEAIELVRVVNRANFQMMVDYSFLAAQHDDPNGLLAAGDHLRHIHISNPEANRTYPMSRSESDYDRLFTVLKKIGYHGGISVHGSTNSFSSDAPRAITLLRTMAAELSTAPAKK